MKGKYFTERQITKIASLRGYRATISSYNNFLDYLNSGNRSFDDILRWINKEIRNNRLRLKKLESKRVGEQK